MAKILVLGSSGQIGAPLVRHLRENGHEAIEFDIVRDPTEDLRITDNIELHAILEGGVDFVYFLAFDVGGSKYLKTYEQTYEFISNNARIMDVVFSFLAGYDVPFIFASSQMANMSYSVYGQLKAVGESYTRSLGGLNVKFWNVYGYEEDEEKAHVITDFIRMAQEDGVIRMMTDGSESRQFLYVEDCVRGLEMLRNAYDLVDREQEICLTNYEWSTIMNVANIVSGLTGAAIVPAESKDTVQLDKRNEPTDYFHRLWYDQTKTLWPKYSLVAGIKDVIRQMEDET